MPYEGSRFLGRLAVPEGFEPFGWCSRPAGSMKDRDTGFTVMHLHDPGVEMREQRMPGGGRIPWPWVGLCGARFAGRWRQYVTPGDAPAYCTKHCDRCLRAVAEREHALTFTTHRSGVGNRYGRGTSGSGYRYSHVRCSCGWQNDGNVTKRDQLENVRDHIRGVVEQGLWRVERERYDPVVTTRPFGYVEEAAREGIEQLGAGQSFACETRLRFSGTVLAAKVTRIALPLRRMEG